MTGNILRLLAAAGFAAAVLLPAGGALADQCGKSHRAAPPSCVTWWYEGDWDWYKGSWHYKKAYAKNNCEGEMVLKIDISGGGSDDLWHLANGQEKRGTYGKTIRNVKCCTRMGDGCNQRTLTNTTCEENYYKSTAADTCRSETFEQSGVDCTIHAECYGFTTPVLNCTTIPGSDTETCAPGVKTEYGPTTAYVKSLDAAKLKNCSGHLMSSC